MPRLLTRTCQESGSAEVKLIRSLSLALLILLGATLEITCWHTSSIVSVYRNLFEFSISPLFV